MSNSSFRPLAVATSVALLSVLLLASSSVSAGELYRWTDSSGRVYYSNMPPRDGGADVHDIKVHSYGGPAAVSTVDGDLSSPASVVMYSAEWCGICKRAKRYMREKGIHYEEYDVEKSAKGMRDYRKLDGKGVPIFLVGDQRMDGFSPNRLQAMLAKAASR